MEAPSAGSSSAQGSASEDKEQASNPHVGPPSPLSGAYLFLVIGEPRSEEDKQTILQKITKGFLSWDVESCHVDLEKELSILTSEAPEGEEAKNGERLIQYASENLVTEVLIHPQLNTMVQCIRNLLSSFTRHRHIIHAGYTFTNSGSWILQDGTFSLADFVDAFQEIEVQRVLRAYENTVTVDVHCAAEGEWSTNRLAREQLGKLCKVTVNPLDKLSPGSEAVKKFVDYLGQYLQPTALEELLEPSDVVGNIRFSHPTLYVFPGGQGDAALFGINGFNMLVDGGFSRKACFWNFVRHLDRLDAVLMTRINNCNINGISSLVKRKRKNPVYPQIGHFFCNLQERKHILSPDGDKDKDRLLINLLDVGHDLVQDLRFLHLRPHPCYRENIVEPINLYHKVGHGKLDMYVLSPAKDNREVREFISKWHTSDAKLFSKKLSDKDNFPLPNIVSISALLVWQPANPSDSITRILFPGSAPQHKILEGFEKIKHLEFLRHPVCSAKSLSPSVSAVNFGRSSSKQRPFANVEKSMGSDGNKTRTANVEANEKTVTKSVSSVSSVQKSASTVPSAVTKAKVTTKTEVKKSDVTDGKQELDSEIISKNDAISKDGKEKKEPKLAMKPDDKLKANLEKKEQKAQTEMKSAPKPKTERSRVADKKTTVGEKETKSPPGTPKKVSDSKVVNGKTEINKLKTVTKTRSPSATPAKSTKEEKNRKVVESKTVTRTARSTSRPPPAVRKQPIIGKKEEDKKESDKKETDKKETEKKETDKKETEKIALKTERKVIQKRKKSPEKPKDKPKSPVKAAKPIKSTKVVKKKQEERAKSIVSAVTSAVSTVGKELLAKSPEKETISIVCEKVDLQSGRKEETIISMKNEQNISADGEIDEVLIIEKVEMVPDSAMSEGDTAVVVEEKEDEILGTDETELQKQALDLLENEKTKKEPEEEEISQKDKVIHELTLTEGEKDEAGTALKEDGFTANKSLIKEEVDEIITSATDIVTKNERDAKLSTEVSSEEQKDGISDSPEKPTTPEKISEEKLPDFKDKSKEKEVESQPDEKASTTVESGATTAPTMPEDEKIPLDNINEIIEEKYAKEETKEKDIFSPQKAEEYPNLSEVKPDSEFMRKPAQSIRDVVKTPDEVADLPIHEEVDDHSFDELGPEHTRSKDPHLASKLSDEKKRDSEGKDKATPEKASKDKTAADSDEVDEGIADGTVAKPEEQEKTDTMEKEEKGKTDAVNLEYKLPLREADEETAKLSEKISPVEAQLKGLDDEVIDISTEKHSKDKDIEDEMIKTTDKEEFKKAAEISSVSDIHESICEKEVSFEKPVVEDSAKDETLLLSETDIKEKDENKVSLAEKLAAEQTLKMEGFKTDKDGTFLLVEKTEIREKSDDELSEKGSPEKYPLKSKPSAAYDAQTDETCKDKEGNKKTSEDDKEFGEAPTDKVSKTTEWSINETSMMLPAILEKSEDKESQETEMCDAKQKLELSMTEKSTKGQDILDQVVETEPEYKTLRPGQVEYVMVTPDSTPGTPRSPSVLTASELKHDTDNKLEKPDDSASSTGIKAEILVDPTKDSKIISEEKQETCVRTVSGPPSPEKVESQPTEIQATEEITTVKRDLKLNLNILETSLPEDSKLPSLIQVSDSEIITATSAACDSSKTPPDTGAASDLVKTGEGDAHISPISEKECESSFEKGVELSTRSKSPLISPKAESSLKRTPEEATEMQDETQLRDPDSVNDTGKQTSPTKSSSVNLEKSPKGESPITVAEKTFEELAQKSPSPIDKFDSPKEGSPVPPIDRVSEQIPKSPSPADKPSSPKSPSASATKTPFTPSRTLDQSAETEHSSKSTSPVEEPGDSKTKSPVEKTTESTAVSKSHVPSPTPSVEETKVLSPETGLTSKSPTLSEKEESSKAVSPVPSTEKTEATYSASHSPVLSPSPSVEKTKSPSPIPEVDQPQKFPSSIDNEGSPKAVSPVTLMEKIGATLSASHSPVLSPTPSAEKTKSPSPTLETGQPLKSPPPADKEESPKSVSPIPSIEKTTGVTLSASHSPALSPTPSVEKTKSPSPILETGALLKSPSPADKEESPKSASPIPSIEKTTGVTSSASHSPALSPTPSVEKTKSPGPILETGEKLKSPSQTDKEESPKSGSPIPLIEKTSVVTSSASYSPTLSPTLPADETKSSAPVLETGQPPESLSPSDEAESSKPASPTKPVSKTSEVSLSATQSPAPSPTPSVEKTKLPSPSDKVDPPLKAECSRAISPVQLTDKTSEAPISATSFTQSAPSSKPMSPAPSPTSSVGKTKSPSPIQEMVQPLQSSADKGESPKSVSPVVSPTDKPSEQSLSVSHSPAPSPTLSSEKTKLPSPSHETGQPQPVEPSPCVDNVDSLKVVSPVQPVDETSGETLSTSHSPALSPTPPAEKAKSATPSQETELTPGTSSPVDKTGESGAVSPLPSVGKPLEISASPSPEPSPMLSNEKPKSSVTSHELEQTPRSTSPAEVSESSKPASPIPSADKVSSLTSSTSISPALSPTPSTGKEKTPSPTRGLDEGVRSTSPVDKIESSKIPSPSSLAELHSPALSPMPSPEKRETSSPVDEQKYSPMKTQSPRDKAGSPISTGDKEPAAHSPILSPIPSVDKAKTSSPSPETKLSPRSQSPLEKVESPPTKSPVQLGDKTGELSSMSPPCALSSVPSVDKTKVSLLAEGIEIAAISVSSTDKESSPQASSPAALVGKTSALTTPASQSPALSPTACIGESKISTSVEDTEFSAKPDSPIEKTDSPKGTSPALSVDKVSDQASKSPSPVDEAGSPKSPLSSAEKTSAPATSSTPTINKTAELKLSAELISPPEENLSAPMPSEKVGQSPKSTSPTVANTAETGAVPLSVEVLDAATVSDKKSIDIPQETSQTHKSESPEKTASLSPKDKIFESTSIDSTKSSSHQEVIEQIEKSTREGAEVSTVLKMGEAIVSGAKSTEDAVSATEVSKSVTCTLDFDKQSVAVIDESKKQSSPQGTSESIIESVSPSLESDISLKTVRSISSAETIDTVGGKAKVSSEYIKSEKQAEVDLKDGQEEICYSSSVPESNTSKPVLSDDKSLISQKQDEIQTQSSPSIIENFPNLNKIDSSAVSTTTTAHTCESAVSEASVFRSSSDESEQHVERGLDPHSSTQSTCGSPRTTGSTPPTEEITEGSSQTAAKDTADTGTTSLSFTSFIKSGFETVVEVLHDTATKTVSSFAIHDDDTVESSLEDQKSNLEISPEYTACSKDALSTQDTSKISEELKSSSVSVEGESKKLVSTLETTDVTSDSVDLPLGDIVESMETTHDNQLTSPTSKSFKSSFVHTSESLESSGKISSSPPKDQVTHSISATTQVESSYSPTEQTKVDSKVELAVKKQSLSGSPTSERSSKSSSPLPPSDVSSKRSSPIPPNDQSPKSSSPADHSFKDTDKSLSSLPTDKTTEATQRLSITDTKLDTSSVPAYSRSSALSTSAPSPDESLTSVSPMSGTDKSSKPISPLLSTDETTKSTVHEEKSLKFTEESMKEISKLSSLDLSDKLSASCEKVVDSVSPSSLTDKHAKHIITETIEAVQSEMSIKSRDEEEKSIEGEDKMEKTIPSEMSQSFYSFTSKDEEDKMSLEKSLEESMASFNVKEIGDQISKKVIEELESDESSEILKSFIHKSKSEVGVADDGLKLVPVLGDKLKAEEQVRSKSFDASPFRGRPMHEVVPDCQPIHARLPADQVKKIETLIEKHSSIKDVENSSAPSKLEAGNDDMKNTSFSEKTVRTEGDGCQMQETSQAYQVSSHEDIEIKTSDVKIVEGPSGKDKTYTSDTISEDQHTHEESIPISGIITELRREAHDGRSSTPGSEISDRDYDIGDRSTPQSDLSSGQISRAGMHMWRPCDSDDELPGSPMSVASHVTHSPTHSECEPESHKISSVMTSSLYGALPETFEQSTEEGHLSGHDMYSSIYVPKEEEEVENFAYSSEYSKQFVLKGDEMINFDKAMKEHRSKRGEDLGSYIEFTNGRKETTSDGSQHLSEDIGNGNISVDNNINRSIPLEHTGSTFTTEPQETTTSYTIGQTIYPEETHSHTTTSTSQVDDNNQDPIGGWGKPLGLPPPPNNINNQNKRILIWNPVEEWGKPLGLPSPAPPPGKEDSNGDIQVDLTPLSNKTTPKKSEKKNADTKNAAAVLIGKESKVRRSESPMKHRSWSRDGRSSRSSPIYVDLAYVPHHGNSLYSAAEFFKRIRARYYVFSAVEPSKEIFDALLEAKQSWEDKDSEVTIIPTYDTDALGYWVSENEELLVKHKIDLSPSASRCTINLQDHETSCSAYRLEF